MWEAGCFAWLVTDARVMRQRAFIILAHKEDPSIWKKLQEMILKEDLVSKENLWKGKRAPVESAWLRWESGGTERMVRGKTGLTKVPMQVQAGLGQL